MFYKTSDNQHGLPHDPFKACIIPRPIGWITSQDELGNLNLAPYSYFNAVSDSPPMVMFATTSEHIEGGPKDSLRNIEETKEFVVNIATYFIKEAINITSTNLPRNQSEIEYANLETIPSQLVKPPRIKASPIHLECTYHQSVQLPTSAKQVNRLIIGHVIGIHINDEILTDGLIDIKKLMPITRLGYTDYAVITEVFSMTRP